MIAATEQTVDCKRKKLTAISGFVVTRGGRRPRSKLRTCAKKATVIIIVGDSTAGTRKEYYEKGISLNNIVCTADCAGSVLDTRIKSLNYLNNILAKIEGSSTLRLHGSGIFRHRNGYGLQKCTAD